MQQAITIETIKTYRNRIGVLWIMLIFAKS